MSAGLPLSVQRNHPRHTDSVHDRCGLRSAPAPSEGRERESNLSQGPYQQHQLEQAHLVFLYGNPDRRGRLRAVVEDCHLRNGVADGISVSTNVAARVYNCDAVDVFRGGFVLTGGHSTADVHTLTTRGTRDPTGSTWRSTAAASAAAAGWR